MYRSGQVADAGTSAKDMVMANTIGVFLISALEYSPSRWHLGLGSRVGLTGC